MRILLGSLIFHDSKGSSLVFAAGATGTRLHSYSLNNVIFRKQHSSESHCMSAVTMLSACNYHNSR
jgi:hypothetical protein